jgi:hypothetical protein
LSRLLTSAVATPASKAVRLHPGARQDGRGDRATRRPLPHYSICGLPYFLSGDVPDWRSLAHRKSKSSNRQGWSCCSRHSDLDRPPAHTLRDARDAARRVRELRYNEPIVATGAHASVYCQTYRRRPCRAYLGAYPAAQSRPLQVVPSPPGVFGCLARSGSTRRGGCRVRSLEQDVAGGGLLDG